MPAEQAPQPSRERFAFVPAPAAAGLPQPAQEARYLIVRLDEQGRLDLQGSREEVEAFLAECAQEGFLVTLDHLSWCG